MIVERSGLWGRGRQTVPGIAKAQRVNYGSRCFDSNMTVVPAKTGTHFRETNTCRTDPGPRPDQVL